jgi:hypothetical protein
MTHTLTSGNYAAAEMSQTMETKRYNLIERNEKE